MAPRAEGVLAVDRQEGSQLEVWAREAGALFLSELPNDPREHTDVPCEILVLGGTPTSLTSMLQDIALRASLRDTPSIAILPPGTDPSSCLKAGALRILEAPFDAEALDHAIGELRAYTEVQRRSATIRDLCGAFRKGHLRGVQFRLRTPRDVLEVAPLIAEMCPDPARQRLGVVELLLNAIEHGNLEIDAETKHRLLMQGNWTREIDSRLDEARYAQRYVDVHLQYAGDAVELLVSDQGAGFCWEAYGEGRLASFDAPFGRGISVARRIAFDELSYLGCGNRVLARATRPMAPVISEAPPSLTRSLDERDLQASVTAIAGSATNELFWRELREFLRAKLDSPIAFAAYFDGSGGVVVPEFASSTSGEDDERAAVFARESWSACWGSHELTRTTLRNAPSEQQLASGPPIARYMAAPVIHEGNPIGSLHVANKLVDYQRRDAKRLQTIADQIAPLLALRLANQQLSGKAAELRALGEQDAHDNELARRVMSKMIRSQGRGLPGVRTFQRALRYFSGDAILVAEAPGPTLRWLLADFVGHGLGAALGSIPLASAFNATTAKGVSLEETVITLNDVVRANLPTEIFCALLICEFCPRSRRLRVWNGGMPPLLVIGEGDRLIAVDSEHLPLGVQRSAELDPAMLSLDVAEGDRVVAFSDGVVEATDIRGELFGMQRIVRELSRESEGGAHEMWSALQDFTLGAKRNDDLSIIEVSPSEWSLHALDGDGDAGAPSSALRGPAPSRGQRRR